MSTIIGPLTKCCPKCDVVKSLSEFYRNRSAPDGRTGWCAECLRTASREHQSRMRDLHGDEWRAKLRENVRRHRETTGNRRGKAYSRARRAATSQLIEAHRAQFEALLAIEWDSIKREEGLS